jgi:hypothetical protein
MRNTTLLVLALLARGAAGSEVSKPLLYVRAASLGLYGGYHTKIPRSTSTPVPTLDFASISGSLVEATYFFRNGLGLGATLVDGNSSLTGKGTEGIIGLPDYYYVGGLAPSVAWIVGQAPHRIGYVRLTLTPYFTGWSAAALDYGLVLTPPWPVEACARVAGDYYWTGGQVTARGMVAVGIRAALGYWFMRR